MKRISLLRGLLFSPFLSALLLAKPLLGAEVNRAQYLMGTLCEIRAIGQEINQVSQAVTLAFEEIARLEQILSTYLKDSEVSRINRLAAQSPQSCSKDLMDILKLSKAFALKTGGAFDITIGPMLRLWRIQTDGRIPRDEEVVFTLSAIGHQHLNLNEKQGAVHFLHNGMALDFGGIGKGYALDRAAEILKKRGVQAALFNFGGQILALGAPSNEKGWPIDISDPLEPQKVLFHLKLANASVSTSSQLERSKNIKGKRVGHIIDPRSGKPVDFEGSVAVIAPTAAEADALSTALLVMGHQEGLAFIEKQKETAAFFLVPSKNDGREILATSRMSLYGFSGREKKQLTAKGGNKK